MQAQPEPVEGETGLRQAVLALAKKFNPRLAVSLQWE